MNQRRLKIEFFSLYFYALLGGCMINGPEDGIQPNERLPQIVHGLQAYEQSKGNFPPSLLAKDGLPMHSWRTLIVPYIESNRFYNSYNLETAWDKGSNQKLLFDESELTLVREVFCGAKDFTSKIVLVLRKSAGDIPYRTGYTRFPSGMVASSAELDERIVLLELAKSDVHWMEPRDLYIEDVLASADLRSQVRSLAIINIATKQVEFIFEQPRKVCDRLQVVASETREDLDVKR